MPDQDDKPRVLLAEDEMFVAMMVEDRLEASGYRVTKAARLSQALELAEAEPFDAAILDINLAGENSYPVADVLRARGIPFVFSSGYEGVSIPEAYRNELVVQKPYDTRRLLEALDACMQAAFGEPPA